MEDLKSMLGKKKASDPAKKESKLGVLKDLKNTMSGMMGSGIKATVAAKNPHDLKAGLEKAKSVVDDLPKEDVEEEKHENPEMSDAEAHTEAEGEEELLDMCDTPEEIDEMIQKLQEKKKELARS